MRRFLTVVAVMGMFLVLSAPGAGAVQPEVEEFSFQDGPNPWTDLNDDVIECKDGVRHTGAGDADFHVIQAAEIEGVHKHFAIKGGQLIKHQTWVGGTDWLINSEDETKVLSGNWHVTDMERTTLAEEPEGVFKAQGTAWHITVPGHGTVFLEAGQIMFDFSLLPDDPFLGFNGRSDFGAFEYDAVCSALS